MRLLPWDELPEDMRTAEVRPYYEALSKKRRQLIVKRIFDVVFSALLLVILSPVFLILAIAIKVDSPGPVFFRQERVTQYGKTFRIFKFRTMCDKADAMGSAVTTSGDARITRVGAKIRDYRLDEISQLLDVFRGTMSFVGTRPGGTEVRSGLYARDEGNFAAAGRGYLFGEYKIQGRSPSA